MSSKIIMNIWMNKTMTSTKQTEDYNYYYTTSVHFITHTVASMCIHNWEVFLQNLDNITMVQKRFGVVFGVRPV